MSKQVAPNTKPFYLSRTFWVNLLLILSMVFPAVQRWAAENPTAMPVIFAFVNLVLRTVTNQAITLSPGGVNQDGGASGGSGGILPLALCFLSAACLLPSCADSGFTGSLLYRDPDSGAKGGLVFVPGEKPSAFVKVPIYDPETGELVGEAELHGSLNSQDPSSK